MIKNFEKEARDLYNKKKSDGKLLREMDLYEFYDGQYDKQEVMKSLGELRDNGTVILMAERKQKITKLPEQCIIKFP